MDAGTNALDILTGRTYPLKLGFVGVVNRSQQDIISDVPMEDARRKEEEFFKGHPVYRNLAHRCGTKFLAKTLNGVSTLITQMGRCLRLGIDESHSRETTGHESEIKHSYGSNPTRIKCIRGCYILRGTTPSKSDS